MSGVKREANDSINDDEPAMKKINMASDDDRRARPDDDVTIRVLVPYSVAGAIIGKKGDALRVLKQETRCHMKMSRNEEGMYPGTNERVLQVKGKIIDVQRCLMIIIQKIGEKLDRDHPKDQFDHSNVPRPLEMKFVVPNTSAGMVIGKQGGRIKEIREATGVNIQVFPKAGSQEASRSQERVISVAAQKVNDLEHATNMIVEKVASDPHHASGPDSFIPHDGMMGPPMGGGPPGPYDGPPPFASNGPPSGPYPGPPMGPNQGPPPPMFGSGPNRPPSPRYSGGNYDGPPMRPSNVSANSTMAPSVKFNPLEGIGNVEVLSFLDNLQTTLRTSGFTEQAVTEVMSAMQILAKYNIMGLGLGLGVAAMAQMRGAPTSQNTTVPSVMSSSTTPMNLSTDLGSQQIGSLYGNNTVNPTAAQATQASAPAQKNFAAGVIKEMPMITNGRMDLEIPELIVLAVLPEGSKRVLDIQSYSGVVIDTSKPSQRDRNVRVVTLMGEPDSQRAARLMIERAINDEHARRQQQARQQQQAQY